MRAALLLTVVALLACMPAASVGTRVQSVVTAPSGKRLAVYESSTFTTQPREVPEEVVIQAMRASSLFFEEDIRAFGTQIVEQLPQLDENQRLVVETSDTGIHLYVAHDELQIVAFRAGQEVSRHASAIPAAAVKTELAVKPQRPAARPDVVVTPAQPPSDEQHARQLADAGTRQYELANYARAIDSWKQAYLLARNAQLLFWIGEAYRMSGDCSQATRFYENYRQAVPSSANRAELDASVKACQRPTKVGAKKHATTKKPAKKKLGEAEISAKIAELDRLLEKELITRAEYDEQKKRLLDQL